MKTSKLSLGIFSIATGSLMAIASPAHALSFTVTTGIPGTGGVTNQGAFSAEAGVTTVDFNSDTVPSTVGIATFTATGDVTIGDADVFGPKFCQTGAPCARNSSFDNVSKYLSIGEDGSLKVSFGQSLTYLGFNFGDSDSDNLVAILKKNGTQIAQYSQQNFFGSAGQQHGYINIFAGNDLFDEVIFSQKDSNIDGKFEIDNLAFRAVPTPALLPGLLGLGLAALRKKSEETSQ